MLLRALARRLRRETPVATLMLAAGCLLTTVPQFFAGEAYGSFTGAPLSYGAWWCWTLPWFSHAPGILVPHLLGNLAVLLSMGLFIEAVLGTRRLAVLSLATLIGTTLLNVLRNGGVGHGASGIFWGYHAFALLFLIVYVELRGRRAFRDALPRIWILLFAFDFAGIPALEVLVMKWRFFDNFGQTTHLASMVIALPFALAWRKPAEEGLKDLIAGKPPRRWGGRLRSALPLAILAAIVALDAGATAYALVRSAGIEDLEYAVSPPASTPIAALGDRIAVDFAEGMAPGSERETTRSIFTKDEDITFRVEWQGARRMLVVLSRAPVAGERLRLGYSVAKLSEGEVRVELDYE
jgi:membrane associated rhomboid family serine protease